MSVIGHSPLAGASGAATAGEGLYVDDVFSTFLYEGTDSTQTINNGIDLSGEGGLVWIKRRDYAYSNVLFDTERGVYNRLYSNSDAAESSNTATLTAFNSNGFSIGDNSFVNSGPTDPSGPGAHVSWTFRKAPGFFDVVTYTGTGSNQNISHSLGSVPGMIIIHCRDGSHDWEVYHRSSGATKSLHLNKTDAEATDSTVWNNTTPTSSVFTVGTSSNVNQNGHGYVAYVFAHDEQSFGAAGNEAIIKCGSYTGNGSTTGPAIDLGFEPQFVLLRCLLRTGGHGGGWYLLDSMRGIFAGERDNTLQTQESNAEDGYGNNPGNSADIDLTPTGFQLTTDANSTNESGRTYIYMAIRRPHKPLTAGTEAFAMDTGSSSSTIPTFDSGFTVDMSFLIHPNSTISNLNMARLLGKNYLVPNGNNTVNSSSSFMWDSNVGWGKDYNSNAYSYMFRRAPGFFDVVTYTGTGSAKTIDHNLEAIPELIIVKNRGWDYGWAVYAQTFGRTKYLYLQSSDSIYTASAGTFWGTSDFTSTQFFLGNYGNTNLNTYEHIAYLFASLDGISKVGSYSGTGSNINVDCGFAAGARFVLIKRTDSSGDWYFWDTLRGIVSGNDPYSLMNTYDAQVTNTDYIDPLNAGFTVTSSAPAALNASGGTYLFLAIA